MLSSSARLLIVAERDGDTVSPERGVYLVDLKQTVNAAEVLARIDRNLAAERALRETGQRMFAPIAAEVATITEGAAGRRQTPKTLARLVVVARAVAARRARPYLARILRAGIVMGVVLAIGAAVVPRINAA